MQEAALLGPPLACNRLLSSIKMTVMSNGNDIKDYIFFVIKYAYNGCTFVMLINNKL